MQRPKNRLLRKLDVNHGALIGFVTLSQRRESYLKAARTSQDGAHRNERCTLLREKIEGSAGFRSVQLADAAAKAACILDEVWAL